MKNYFIGAFWTLDNYVAVDPERQIELVYVKNIAVVFY